MSTLAEIEEIKQEAREAYLKGNISRETYRICMRTLSAIEEWAKEREKKKGKRR